MRKIIDLSYTITITIVLSRVTNKERGVSLEGECCRVQLERLRLQRSYTSPPKK